ncbi:MAG: ABC transporter substrate-binding protein [Armatimonadetes bacterium]|nr:ABC transporter substrate-binding protein [Armatimonadota bacterium]
MRTASRVLLVLVLLALLATASLAQTQERGVTAAEVVIGTSQPLSGPAAFWGLPVTGGMDAYLRFINDQGGIHGRKMRLVALDDSYLPTRAVANVRDLVDRTSVFAIVGLLGSPSTLLLLIAVVILLSVLPILREWRRSRRPAIIHEEAHAR